MRGSSLFFVLACVATLAGSAAAHAASLAARPLARSDAHRSLARARSGRGGLEAEGSRQILEKRKLWKSFPDVWSDPRADRSQFAGRRSGWRPPRFAAPRSRIEHAGPGAPEGIAPEPDHMRVAFIRIDFTNDRGGDQSTGNGHFDLTGPDTTREAVDRPPHNRKFYRDHLEALSRYYDVQSYGRIRVEGDVWPRDQNRAYSLTDMADLGPWSFGQGIAAAAEHMFKTMLMQADSQSVRRGDPIPWSQIDRVVFIHAGGDLQSDVRQDSKEDIPSFTLFVSDSDAVSLRDSVNHAFHAIDRASFIPETNNQDGYFGALNGVIAHECGHLFFGFFDVYNIETAIPTVGFWSLMDYGNGVGAIIKAPDGSEIFATGLLPPSIDPWHRFRFLLADQIPFPEVAYGDSVEPLRNSLRHPDVRKVTLSSDEYLMLENRWITPIDTLRFDQDDTTRVVLGPIIPDRFEYDALLPTRLDEHQHALPGAGILVWQIDESVIPLEYTLPIDTSLRVNPDYGINTNPARQGVSIIEADALDDLGDLGSPFLLGAVFDPYFRSNNPTLSDSTKPNLIPHIGTRPHVRLDFLDDPDTTMHFRSRKTWQLAGWPVDSLDFPPGGPILLAADADGDRNLEVCWAGGADSLFDGTRFVPNPDSTALFAVGLDGLGLRGGPRAFAHLDRRPRPVMAALPYGEGAGSDRGPSYFAVSTYPSGPDLSSAGGRVWLLDDHGVVVPGWPANLPAVVTTAPVMVASPPTVYVGCEDGLVYGIGLDGVVRSTSDRALGGGVRGRLAVYTRPNVLPAMAAGGGVLENLVAAAGGSGEVGVFSSTTNAVMNSVGAWPRTIGGTRFQPDLLWLNFGVNGGDCFTGALSLAIHDADHLWAYCVTGDPLTGWTGAAGDTLVAAMGAGDPDGDGYPELLTQSIDSRIAFWNLNGHPSPGWPRRGTREHFRTSSPPLAADLDGDGKSEVVAMNASGIIAAFRSDGHVPTGWPLATGLATTGSPVIADLDHNGSLEVVAPDRFGVLYGYSVPRPIPTVTAASWPMLGGDAGRTSALILDPSSTPPTATSGPLIGGSLRAYPNPARRRPVSFAYQLSEPAQVEFRIMDASGHEVASFSRRGHQSENVEVWEPGTLPAGLYIARLRFQGSGAERIEVIPVGLLR